MIDVIANFTIVQAGLSSLLVFALLAVLWMAARRRRMRHAENPIDVLTEREAREQVSRKAAESAESVAWARDGVRNLTDSGIFPVVEMIDALAGSGNYTQAEKWALNAMRNQPNRLEIPMKLAEVYYRAGRKSAFLAVASGLMRKYEQLPEEAQNRLMTMVWELTPDESAPGAAQSA